MPDGKRWAATINCLSTLLLFLTSVASAQLANPEQWAAPEQQSHALVGRIWSHSAQEFISVETLGTKLSQGSYVLLGEKHDNPDHHILQRTVLEDLIGGEVAEQVTFEMLDSLVQERLLKLYLQAPMNSQELKAYLMWDADGWDWSFYGPLLESAYSAGLRMSAGNLSRDEVSSIYSDAATDSPVLDASALAVLRRDIDASHCGMLPQSQFPAMVRVQQARDAAMAAAMDTPKAGGTNILIAGNYHVRRDVGVPRYLFLGAPNLSTSEVIALSFSEVQPGQTDPSDYQEVTGRRHAYDFIWFTPSVEAQDYCASIGQ